MIDIHSHVLPGLDDGARTIEESLEMLHLAAASGTTDIVATPHASPAFLFEELRTGEVFRELADKSSAFIRLHLGCDFHLSYENLHDALSNPGKYTINHQRYLMVELPDLVALSSVRQGLQQLIAAHIIPVITHPERNISLQPRLSELERWNKDGCFMQITGQSFLGRFGPAAKHAADELMRAGLVHFIASDAHDCRDRPPDLSRAYQYISSKHGTEWADLIFLYNPAAAISGETLPENVNTSRKPSRFFRFWK
jgi:protein-tyrosine phosphatase